MRVINGVLGSVSLKGSTPMDAMSSDRNQPSYFDPAPVLVAGTSDAAMARAMATIEAAGLRVAAAVPIAQAIGRIERQVTLSAVWIELDSDCNGEMDALLAHVSHDAADGRYAAVVATPAKLLDPVAASAGAIDVVVDGDDADRAAALAMAARGKTDAPRLSDVASDQNAARLRQLSEEVSRIATTLARLSTGPQTAPRRVEAMPAADAPEISAETVRAVIRARRLRARYFPEELFADPAWDMLLDLLQAEIAHLRVPVSSLCIAAAVPATTALRWLKTLVQEGLFVRRADPHDGRRVFVELAPDTSSALRRYFAEVGQAAVI
jgi:hypothetical protein